MGNSLLRGAYAALLTPRSANGEVDGQGLEHLLDNLERYELNGYALNGATGEFCSTTAAEVRLLARIMKDRTQASHRQWVCGIGATSVRTCLQLAEIAAQTNAVAVLLPTPYFFKYDSGDVIAFVSAVADRCPLPVLLYNLPQFSSPFLVPSALQLISEHPNIIGIKDSSGSTDILSALTTSNLEACRIVGNDSVLAQAHELQLCDAVISGVACALPELICSIFHRDNNAAISQRRLTELLDAIAPFPTPWAIKFLAEARGFAAAQLLQAVSPLRQKQSADLVRWFHEWWPLVLSS